MIYNGFALRLIVAVLGMVLHPAALKLPASPVILTNTLPVTVIDVVGQELKFTGEAFQPHLHIQVSPPDSSWLSARVPSCERSFLFLPELKLTSSRRIETRWHTRIIKLVYG
jgi:hypothetical protein